MLLVTVLTPPRAACRHRAPRPPVPAASPAAQGRDRPVHPHARAPRCPACTLGLYAGFPRSSVVDKAGWGLGPGPRSSPACLPGFDAGRCLLDSNFGNPGSCHYTQGDALIPTYQLCEKTAPVRPYRKHPCPSIRSLRQSWGAAGSAGTRVPLTSADAGSGSGDPQRGGDQGARPCSRSPPLPASRGGGEEIWPSAEVI